MFVAAVVVGQDDNKVFPDLEFALSAGRLDLVQDGDQFVVFIEVEETLVSVGEHGEDGVAPRGVQAQDPQIFW